MKNIFAFAALNMLLITSSFAASVSSKTCSLLIEDIGSPTRSEIIKLKKVARELNYNLIFEESDILADAIVISKGDESSFKVLEDGTTEGEFIIAKAQRSKKGIEVEDLDVLEVSFPKDAHDASAVRELIMQLPSCTHE